MLNLTMNPPLDTMLFLTDAYANTTKKHWLILCRYKYKILFFVWLKKKNNNYIYLLALVCSEAEVLSTIN